MTKNIIVIPIYKTELSNFEILSVQQAIKILSKNNALCFVHPKNFDTQFYTNNFKLIQYYYSFDDFYFKNLEGYNKLLLSVDFYNQFKDFDYMLLYQTDAYIFEDNLAYWCSKNYDYIGGIWFEGYIKDVSESTNFLAPGNGGFSLRKIKSFIKVLCSNEKYYTLKQSKNKTKTHIKNFFKHKKLSSIAETAKKTNQNEDIFFVEVSKSITNFSVPSTEEALFFSWDRCPDYLFKKYKKFPMACHAWFREDIIYKNNLKFWRNHIPLKTDN